MVENWYFIFKSHVKIIFHKNNCSHIILKMKIHTLGNRNCLHFVLFFIIKK